MIPFCDITVADADIVGGKGANLGELTRAGFPVPNGFCVTRHAYEDRANPAVVSAIHEAYRALVAESGDAGALVAVRSSATAEDSKEASFAGQLETYLSLRGEEEVMRSVRLCWDSLFSERVTEYRKLAGLSEGHASITCCVVIQLMAKATSAGVMFTGNPITRRREETVISANWGLGETVVADMVTPDTWVVSETGILRADRGKKTRQIVLGKKEPVPVPEEKQAVFALMEEQVLELFGLGQRVEEHYGAPQDIEWAVDNGKVLLLQTRPITTSFETVTLPTLTEFDGACDEEDWITTCNAREMFPGAGTPLTITTLGEGINYSMQRLHMHFGVRDRYEKDKGIIVWRFGSMFLNMTNTLAPMCTGMIGGDLAKQNGEMSILGRLNDECSLQDLTKCGTKPIWSRLFNGMRYAKTLCFAYRRPAIMRKRIQSVGQVLEGNGFEADDAQGKYERIQSIYSEYLEQWADGVVCGATSAGFMVAVMKLLCKSESELWTPAIVAQVAALIASPNEDGVAESCDVVNSLDQIKETLLQDRENAKRFCDFPVDEGLQFLQTSDAPSAVLFRTVLERHGHRCIKESEMRRLEWRADPKPLVQLLQSSVRAGLSNAYTHAEKADPNESEARILSSKAHLNFITKALLKLFIRLTRSGVRRRELGKSLQVELNTVVKKAFRGIAEQLVDDGKLPDPDCVYFVSYKELGQLCKRDCDPAVVASLKIKALQRRRLLPRQESLLFQDLYKGPPVPNDDNPPSSESKSSGLIELKGTPVSTGVITARLRVIRTLEESSSLQPGEILMCPITDVGWTPLFAIAGGLCTEIGGMLSHGAVVAREYGLPCIVNLTNGCSLLKTGQKVELNGNDGTLRVLEDVQDTVESKSVEVRRFLAEEVVLTGTAVGTGKARGPARVARTLEEAHELKAGEILVCPITDVGWTPFFAIASGKAVTWLLAQSVLELFTCVLNGNDAARDTLEHMSIEIDLNTVLCVGLVTEIGGMLSHGAVVAREYGLPCIVNIPTACAQISTGQMIEVDGETGELKLLAQ